MTTQKSHQIQHVLLLTFVLNLSVSLAKLVYGYHAGVLSMVSDGFHSLMDSTSNVVGFVAIRYAFAPPDEEHPYGHRKAEMIASLAISFMLGLTCLEIAQTLWQRWWNPTVPIISTWAFVVMLVGLFANLLVVIYEERAGKRLNSPLLLADAAHTRSDVLVTTAVLLSLFAIQVGWYGLDFIVSLGIMGVIARIGYHIFTSNLPILMDHLIINEHQMKEWIEAIPGILHCHKVRAHGTPDAMYLDLHIWVSAHMSIADAHQLAHQAKDKLKAQLQTIADVTIHIEPAPLKYTEADSIYPHT